MPKHDPTLPWSPPRDLSSKEGRETHAQDCAALQALERGEAQPHQQQRVLQMLIYKLCGTYDLEFRPGGEDGRRASDFAGGKRWVGTQLVTMLAIQPASLLQRDEQQSAPRRG